MNQATTILSRLSLMNQATTILSRLSLMNQATTILSQLSLMNQATTILSQQGTGILYEIIWVTIITTIGIIISRKFKCQFILFTRKACVSGYFASMLIAMAM